MKTRSMAAAVADGTAFRLAIPGWAEPYWPPAAESPAEVAECYRDMVTRGWARPVKAGTIVKAERVLDGSTIGFTVVEDAGTVTF